MSTASRDEGQLPWPNVPLTDAAMVGHVDGTSAKIWVRAAAGGEHWLLVVPAEPGVQAGFAAAVDVLHRPHASLLNSDGPVPLAWSEVAQFSADHDWIHVYEVRGLSPGTSYLYGVGRVEHHGADAVWQWLLGRDGTHHFRTAPTDATEARFAVVSCHMPYGHHGQVENLSMWEGLRHHLSTTHGDFVLTVGDQVYCDGPRELDIWRLLAREHGRLIRLPPEQRHRTMVGWYREIYRGYWGHSAVTGVLQRFPTYCTWDDHEIWDGWGSRTNAEVSQALDSFWRWEHRDVNLELAREMFAAAAQVYDEYQHSRNPTMADGRTDHARDYALSWGPAALYVLDLRSERKTEQGLIGVRSRVLGQAQEQRLAAWLREMTKPHSPYDILLIVSSVPLLHANDVVLHLADVGPFADDLRDQWGHVCHADERERLLATAFRGAARGKLVAFISGDVHMGACYEMQRGSDRVYQLISSPITYAGTGRRVSGFASAETGWLPEPPSAVPRPRTAYRRHRLCSELNFGAVTAGCDDAGPFLRWELLGADAGGLVTRVPPVELRREGAR